MSEFKPLSTEQVDTLNPDLMTVLGEPDQAIVAALHPDSLRLQDDIDSMIASLHRLPFVTRAELSENFTYPEGPYTGQQIENATFPVSRIISVQGFQSWAGRGRNPGGRIIDNGGYSSASAIHHYAKKEPDPDYVPTIQLFKDRDGTVWGFMNIDGAHRTAGAKARGDKALLCTAYTDEYDRLPTTSISIAETILAQSKRRNSFLGRLALRRQAEALTKDSKLFDQRRAAARAEISRRAEEGNGWLEI